MPTVKTRVLIVEDEILAAVRLRRELEKAGYEVYEPLATGAEAVDCALKLHPNAVLMDLRLSGEMDGFEAARKIRASLDIPIIFMSGYVDSDTLARARQFSLSAFLEKPFFPAQADAAIQALHI